MSKRKPDDDNGEDDDGDDDDEEDDNDKCIAFCFPSNLRRLLVHLDFLSLIIAHFET